MEEYCLLFSFLVYFLKRKMTELVMNARIKSNDHNPMIKY